ncbi:MAG: hypothetical protein WCE52_02050 [Candidatus Acidiferrum sp.]
MLDNTLPIALVRHIEHLLNSAEAGLTDADAIRLCDLAESLCGDSIVSARWREDHNAVGVMVKHTPESNPPIENDRFIDILFFAAVCLMCLAGGRVSIEAVRPSRGGKLYYYLRYEHPYDKSEDMRNCHFLLDRTVVRTRSEGCTPVSTTA